MLAATATLIALAGLGASNYNTEKSVVSPPVAAPGVTQPQIAARSAPPSPAAPAQEVVPPPSDVLPPPSPAPVPRPASAATRASVPAAVSAPAAPPPRAPAPPPQRAAVGRDQTFLNQLSGIPGLTVTDPATAAATGRAICKSLQNGASPNDSVQATVNSNSGLTPAQAAAGVNAAITVYCPQYQH